jgi:hypothetical protein
MERNRLILIAITLDLIERCERLKWTAVPSSDERQILEKFFLIERTTTGAAPFFNIKLTKRMAGIIAALGAPKISDDSVHRAIRAKRPNCVRNAVTELIERAVKRLVEHGSFLANVKDEPRQRLARGVRQHDS